MKLPNIESLIDGNGQISLGDVGAVPCAAVACSGTQTLAMLVRDRNESLEALLARVDQAIENALERDIFSDEING